MQQGTCAAVTVLLNAYPESIAVKDNVRDSQHLHISSPRSRSLSVHEFL
jgi:hypothetical protein